MRRFGLDWLRILIVFLLFPFHTARVFDRWEPFYIKDAVNGFSSWFIASIGFWFMALLFVIAGFSSFHALQKRTIKEYIKERILRLFLPFLFGIVLIVPVQGYCAMLQHEHFSGNYIEFLSSYFTDFRDISGYTGGFTPAHLWFILFLFIISLCLLPLLSHLRSPKEGHPPKVWLMLLSFIPMTAAEALPAIGGKNLFFYGLLFLFGFLMARSVDTMALVRRIRYGTLVAAMLISPVYLILAGSLGWPGGINLIAAGVALLRNLCVCLIVLASMGFADTYLNRKSKLLSYLNGASYPVYILHQSVMMIVAFFIVATPLSAPLKFIAIMTGTLAVTSLLYEVFRRFAVTRFILGIKMPSKHHSK